MAPFFLWFFGTLLVPLFIPLDDLFGFPMGSFTVISWVALAVSGIASENHDLRKKVLNLKIENKSPSSMIGGALVWTFALAIGIALVKALFSN